jgi:hypothetical protein
MGSAGNESESELKFLEARAHLVKLDGTERRRLEGLADLLALSLRITSGFTGFNALCSSGVANVRVIRRWRGLASLLAGGPGWMNKMGVRINGE